MVPTLLAQVLRAHHPWEGAQCLAVQVLLKWAARWVPSKAVAPFLRAQLPSSDSKRPIWVQAVVPACQVSQAASLLAVVHPSPWVLPVWCALPPFRTCLA